MTCNGEDAGIRLTAPAVPPCKPAREVACLGVREEEDEAEIK